MSKRFMHLISCATPRYAEAVEWEGLPPVSSFGVNPEGLDVSIAYGRIYVGYEGRLLAYYSDIERLHAFMAWMAKGEEMPKKDEDRALKAGTKVGQKSNVGGGLAKKGEGPAPDEDSERGVSSSRSKRKSRSEEALMQLDGAHEEGALPQLDGAGGGRSSRSRVKEEEHAQDEDDEEANETPKKSARAKGGSAKKGSKDNLDKGDDDGSSTKKKGGSAKKGHGGSSSKKSRKAGDLDNKNDGDEGQDEEDEKEEDPKVRPRRGSQGGKGSALAQDSFEVSHICIVFQHACIHVCVFAFPFGARSRSSVLTSAFGLHVGGDFGSRSLTWHPIQRLVIASKDLCCLTQ